MPRPYANDLRERVADAIAGGMSCRMAAKTFCVSPSSAVKWAQRKRATGSAAAKPMGGVRRAVLADHRVWLLGRVGEKRDLTLQMLQEELAERGAKVSRWAIWKQLAAEGITFKKKPAAL